MIHHETFPDNEAYRDAKSFNDLRSLITWPTVTEIYISPLLGVGAPSRWQVELNLGDGSTVAYSGDTLPEAIENARRARANNKVTQMTEPHGASTPQKDNRSSCV